MALGRRCSIGCETWPDEAVYARCPVCGEETTRYKRVTPLDADEARSILLHAEFEKYYEKRCKSLGIPVEGPLPEKPRKLPLTIVQHPGSRSGGGAQAQSA